MNPTLGEINAAVLAVLGGMSRPAKAEGRPAPHHRDVFVDRLFALRHAEGVGDGIDEVRILAGTVVTPLARDLLKRRRIGLRVVSGREAELARGTDRGEWGFAIDSRSGAVEALRRLLLEGRDWAEVDGDPASWVVGGDGRGAFVIADEASVATWRASRVEGVRAASVGEPDAVSRAIRHIGANLIVVEPAGKSIYLLKQIGERFRLGGAPAMPESLSTHTQPAATSVGQAFLSARNSNGQSGMPAPPNYPARLPGQTNGVAR